MNDYGLPIRYDSGDRVRIWKVFKNPIGTVEEIEDATTFPVKYLVRYMYLETGLYYTEIFEAQELTLVERRSNYHCNCGTDTERHSNWCNRSSNFGSTL